MKHKGKGNTNTYPKTIELTSKEKSKILPIVGITLIIFMFTLWSVGIYYMIYGGMISRTITLLLYAFQFTQNGKNTMFLWILKKCKIYDYFPKYTIILEEELRESRSLFASHPHGIIALGMGTCLFSSDIPALEKTLICGTRFVRNLPLSGLLARWIGIYGVDPKNFKELMKQEKNILFIPGGFECATITNDKHDKTYVRNRKGFVKYALENGYFVHPCYTFNENRIYYTINGLEKLGMFLNKIKIPGCFFYGKFLLYPRNDVSPCIAIGKAISFPKIEKPTKEDIEKYHNMYMESLNSLYQRYRKQYGGSEELQIV